MSNTCSTRYRKLKQAAERRATYAAEAAYEARKRRTREADDGNAETEVTEALEKLGPADRRIIILRHISNLSLKEIGETLGIGLSAAKMRLYRAQEHFRQCHRERNFRD